MKSSENLSTRSLVKTSIVLSLLFSGCGESAKPSRGVPVSGTITMGGVPLEGASVTFMNDTFVGYGTTDSSGKYSLVQGALPGQNKVTISKVEGGDVVVGDAESGMDSGQMEAAALGNSGADVPKLPVDLVPEEYSNPAKTKLTFEVPSGGESGVDFSI